MRALTAKEKRLLIGLVAALFVLLNVVGLQAFLNRQRALQSNIVRLQGQLDEGRALLAEKDFWEERAAWLNEHQPADDTTTTDDDAKFYEFIETSAKNAGLTYTRRDAGQQSEEGTYAEVFDSSQVKGNMGLAMKLNGVIAAARKATAGAPKPTAGPALKSKPLFDEMAKAVSAQGASLVKKVNGVIQFNVKGADGAVVGYNVDLKNGSGKLTQCSGKSDLTLKISDDHFVALAAGKLNPQQAFMQGKIKLKGNLGLAMKLQTVIAAIRPASKL